MIDGSPRSVEGGKVKESGCTYHPSTAADWDAGVGVEILATNMSYEYFRDVFDNRNTDGSVKQFEIGGRRSATKRSDKKGMCSLFVTVKGGGLKLDTLTHDKDSCDVLTSFMTKLAPSLPAGT
jgi:hypothetical protein